MKFLLAFLGALAAVQAGPVPASTPSPTTCPDGFTELNSNKCVKFFDKPSIYQDALNFCQNLTNGNLLSIHNAIDNRAVVNIASSQNSLYPIWLGLTCSSSSIDSCTWSDGTGGIGGYSNFFTGYPVPEIGNNVYIVAAGSSIGKWMSTDGSKDLLNFFCEVPPVNVTDPCENPFNECCYTLNKNVPFVNEANAREYCQSQCGDLVSIHSQEENDHVMALAYGNNLQQIRIGSRAGGGGKYWVDASYFDFTNFGNFDPSVGSCSALQVVPGSVRSGQWLSDDCNDNIPFVCKRLKGVTSCPTTGPTFNPNQCFGTHYFTGNGTMYSPNYPNSYFGMAGTCSYVFTVPSGMIAQIQVQNMKLDSGSNLSLYSGSKETKPLMQLTGSMLKSPPISSETNVLKMVFNNREAKFDSSTRWVVTYGYNL